MPGGRELECAETEKRRHLDNDTEMEPRNLSGPEDYCQK